MRVALVNANRMGANYFLRGWGPSYLGAIVNGRPQGGNTYVLSYDPSNGTVSLGDIIYHGPGMGFAPTQFVYF